MEGSPTVGNRTSVQLRFGLGEGENKEEKERGRVGERREKEEEGNKEGMEVTGNSSLI